MELSVPLHTVTADRSCFVLRAQIAVHFFSVLFALFYFLMSHVLLAAVVVAASYHHSTNN